MEVKQQSGLRRIMSRFRPATKHDIQQLEARIMVTLNDIQRDMAEESTLIDGLSTLITGLRQQVADALARNDAATQAKVDAIFAQAEANKAKLTAALTANTPVAYNAQG